MRPMKWESGPKMWITCDRCGHQVWEPISNVPHDEDEPFFCEQCRETYP
jgi:hypothetical protein